MVSSTPRPHSTPGKDPVLILREGGWAPWPIWTGGKSRPHRDSIPDRPARSQYILITYINSVAAELKCLWILTPKLVTGHDPGTVPPTFTSHSLLCRYFLSPYLPCGRYSRNFRTRIPHALLLSRILATFPAHRSFLDFAILTIPVVMIV